LSSRAAIVVRADTSSSTRLRSARFRDTPWLRRTTARLSSATFVFADIAGFTALTEAHGDEEAAGLVADVDPEHAAGRLMYEDTAYFFCTLACAAEFARYPERFAS
jgi:class 3 adenylate cyclase